MIFLRNAGCPAAWEGDRPIARTFLNEPVLLPMDAAAIRARRINEEAGVAA